MKNLTRIALLFTLIALGGSCFAQCANRCQAAFRFVISHEDHNLSGVVTAEPLGGFARFGINSRANHKAVRDGFYKMKKARALAYAQELFYTNYWSPIHGDDVSDRKLAFRMADLSFNLGTVRATKLLQRALSQQGAYLPVGRGYFGYDTLFYANTLPPAKTVKLLKRQAHSFYVALADKYPAMRTWKGVWFDRLAEEEETGVPMPDWLADYASEAHAEPVLGVDIIQWRIQFERPIYVSRGIGVPCGHHSRSCYWASDPRAYRPSRSHGRRGEPVIEIFQQEGEIIPKEEAYEPSQPK
jgi:lysozyme family protein